jgi:hypothetical protein
MGLVRVLFYRCCELFIPNIANVHILFSGSTVGYAMPFPIAFTAFVRKHLPYSVGMVYCVRICAIFSSMGLADPFVWAYYSVACA